MAAWIRNADPDPGGLKRAKKKGKKRSQKHILRHKKYKKAT
jgi:hypothetical protein